MVKVHESEWSTCLNARAYGLLAGFNVPVLDESQGHGEVANFRVSVIPVYPAIARVMVVGDYCGAFIPLVAEIFGHTMTEVAVGVEIAERRLWICIEDLQTMELIRFVLGRPSPTKLLALRQLCVAAQMEICVQAIWTP